MRILANAEELRPRNDSPYYIYAIIGGLVLFGLFVFAIKFLSLVFGQIKAHWVWLIVGVLVLIFIKKKFFTRR